jgi:hypothetical protein
MGSDVTVEEVGEVVADGERASLEDASIESSSMEKARAPVPGRLPVLTGLSFAVAAIPLPLLPSRALLHLRGAVVQEVSARHGLSLTSDAREALATPSSSDAVRAVFRRGVELVTRRLLRRLGPLGPLSTLARTYEVYALGHLLDRYFSQVRVRGTVRMLEPEARRLRRVIDASTMRAFHPATEADSLQLRDSPEDLRDEFTRWIDGALLSLATIPSFLQRRLDAAFDEIVERTPELRED